MAKVNFRTHTHLKSIIGKDLITDDNIAVQELVKNSFDAGSKNVDIIFKNISHNQTPKKYKKLNNSELIILDYGVGMSEYDLINKWLNIAYSEKKIKKEEFNRTLAGNKGVGRFSCDRLGKLLTIYTKRSNQKCLKLFIDWREFEQLDDITKNIQDVKFDLDEITENQFNEETSISEFDSGTLLVIGSLREEWDHSKVLSLKRQLEKLINPNESFKSEKFYINIIAKELLKIDSDKEDYEKVNGLVENKIFEKLNFKVSSIQSKISKDGEKIITILKDKGRTIFTLVEKNPFSLLKDIKVYIYYLNPYSKAYFKKQTGIRSFEFGSISLFINGFRIPPYGDSGDDWLGMEGRKGQGRTRYLGTREVIGRIEIKDNEDTLDDEDNEFKIISSRSGVRNNKIFTQLAKSKSPFGYYYKIFRRLEKFVVEGIKWDSVTERNYDKLEKKVLNDPKWDESKEDYVIDSLSRNKQILSVIDKIVNSKDEEIIKLSIDKSFVSELIDQQKEKTLSEIEEIAESLKDKDLSAEELKNFIYKIDISQNELDSFPISEVEILELKAKQNELQTLLNNEVESKKLVQESKRLAEEETERLANELELEKQKYSYLVSTRRDLSKDAEGLVHNIKLNTGKIKSNVETIVYKTQHDGINKRELLKRLGAIRFSADKALKISNIITRANFKTEKEKQIIDIPKFIEQYALIYEDMFNDNKVEFLLNIEDELKFESKKSVLDLSVIFDDMVSNSLKANAKKIIIDISLNKEKDLEIIFSDNGIGLSKIFDSDPDKIFELGITTTDGSGIGLFYVKDTLKKMNATIDLDKNFSNKGLRFIIVFKK